MGVGMCLYPLCPACANKNKQCKSAIILQCYHHHLSDFCSRPPVNSNHIINDVKFHEFFGHAIFLKYFTNFTDGVFSGFTLTRLTFFYTSNITFHAALYKSSDIPVTETHTDTEMTDTSKTHTETNTEKIFNTDTIYI